MKKIITFACLTCLPLSTFADNLANNEALNLLHEMTQSLSQKSYKGILAHGKNGNITTLKVSHTMENGEEVERVERQDKNGTAYSRKVTNYSLSKLPKFNEQMQAVYSFDLGKIKKVASRPCQLVIARPKDRMRYLQKYCVDTETSLLLDYTIIDKSHKTIEQFVFTNLEILDENTVKSGITLASAPLTSNSHSDLKVNLLESSVVPETDALWSLKETIKGFSLRKAPMMQQEQGESATDHYILSDGLSSVSIFISKKAPDSKETGTHSGALNVVTYYKNNFVITLVGAVPKSTLKSIFHNLQYKAH
ncbi:MAG: MucB/RseB C-terminal domain-containing protein [Cocleimonas sp.]|nr:MucB/RseB C-terminal domain-containing protein [Cocleimonas sp.]